jgi:carbon dioxide concentrating mechanism protein CcmN
MHSPSLQLHPVSVTHYCVSGDVTIDKGVAIAPGVLLQADPDSQIVIRVGVCLGIGTVVHAHGGTIEICSGANLGAGVLVVGQLVIGDRAIVGAMTTLFNYSVEANALIPPSSLLIVEETPAASVSEPQSEAELPQVEDPWAEKSEVSKEIEQESDEIDSPLSPEVSAQSNGVYGQAYVNQMIGRLFPNQPKPPEQNF